MRLELGTRLDLRANAGAELPTRFAGIAYTGKAVHRGSCVIDLATATVTPRMGLLDSHGKGTEAILGVVESARVEGGQLLVSGSLFSDIKGSKAEQIAMLAARGTEWQVSVGCYDHDEELIPAGQRVMVNGQSFTGPIMVLRNGVIRECSIVVLGADGDTSVALLSQPTRSGPAMTELAKKRDTSAKLQADLATARARLEAANKALAEAKAAAETDRRAEIVKLLAECNVSLTDEEHASFLAMPPGVFSIVARSMRQTAASPSLTSHVYKMRAAQSAGKPVPEARKGVELTSAGVYKRRAEAMKLH